MPTIEIRPNEKYDAIYGTSHAVESEEERAQHETEHEQTQKAVDHVMMDTERVVKRAGPPREEMEDLTWSDLSPPNDPDLLTQMATYFEGIEPTDNSELIRAKLRIGKVWWMAKAQIAAKEERKAAA